MRRAQRDVSQAMLLSNSCDVSPDVATAALKKGFTGVELALMAGFVKAKVLMMKHGDMCSMCANICDDDGEAHHLSAERTAGRELNTAAQSLRRRGFSVKFVRASLGAGRVRRWKFTKQTVASRKVIEITKDDVSFD